MEAFAIRGHLHACLRILLPGAHCMVRVDTRGSALLVTDAPRAATDTRVLCEALCTRGFVITPRNTMLHLDVTPARYAAWATSLYAALPPHPHAAHGARFAQELAALYTIIARDSTPIPGHPALPDALRGALRACLLGEAAVREYVRLLQALDAQALRLGHHAVTEACARLITHWAALPPNNHAEIRHALPKPPGNETGKSQKKTEINCGISRAPVL